MAVVEIIDSIRAGDETLMDSLKAKLASAEAVEPAAASGLVECYKRPVVRADQQATEASCAGVQSRVADSARSGARRAGALSFC